eukprot:TRINITY_DN16450_c0_g1_i4.p4 TRINITY_DN16450_c0_g1~~TRINITY_DN16450_c0_g1_i4.p4  ORF type:complete len:109 (-),score=7.82 TRINITY_DN16450_c0_g1_i4:23-349(-)
MFVLACIIGRIIHLQYIIQFLRDYVRNLNIVSRFSIKLDDRMEIIQKFKRYNLGLNRQEKIDVVTKLINWSDKEVLLGLYIQVFGKQIDEYRNDVKLQLVTKAKSFAS